MSANVAGALLHCLLTSRFHGCDCSDPWSWIWTGTHPRAGGFRQWPYPRIPNLAKCAKQVSQLTEAEEPGNRQQKCGTIPILVGMSPVHFLTMHMHRPTHRSTGCLPLAWVVLCCRPVGGGGCCGGCCCCFCCWWWCSVPVSVTQCSAKEEMRSVWLCAKREEATLQENSNSKLATYKDGL